jgi:hypothetical protein
MMEWIEKIREAARGVDQSQLEGWLKGRLRGCVTIDGVETRNMITDAGIKAIVKALFNVNRFQSRVVIPSFQIETFGASTSVTAPNAGDTSLGGSVSFRNVEQVDSVGKKMVVTNFIGQPEFNFTWRKIGLFLATGQLFAVTQVVEPKTSQVAKTVIWEIEFEG